MSLNALDAASAYGRVLGTAARAAAAPPTTEAGTSGFAAMVDGLVKPAAEGLRAAETATAQQIAGKGDLIDVVTAIGAAETALETVVAVRDRVVNAYQDIMRMQI
uniref:flagellar hook-basal body complex protein FliE n=1 Tax=uncultured Sphingomonas sp. TaxID=158754 RepID=UPI0025F3AB14|nr:flagellar hook-basal body complex protein FliE [uncultured Sphingomonas sp.]